MKKTVIAVLASIAVGNAMANRVAPVITPVTAVQFNPANQLSLGQEALRNSIRAVTNNLNTQAANLGVTNQVQWTGTAIGGATQNIATDLGELFYRIDNPYFSNSSQNLLSFNASTWTLSGSAPAVNSGGCDITCIITQANQTARNIGLQTTSTVHSMANVIGTRVIAYNTAYGPGASVSSANVATAQADFAEITKNVSDSYAAVDAARKFNFAEAFNAANAGGAFQLATVTGAGTGNAGVSGSVTGTTNGINGNAPTDPSFTTSVTSGGSTIVISATSNNGNLVAPTGLDRMKTDSATFSGTRTGASTTVITRAGKSYANYTNYVSDQPMALNIAGTSNRVNANTNTVTPSYAGAPSDISSTFRNVIGGNNILATSVVNPAVNGGVPVILFQNNGLWHASSAVHTDGTNLLTASSLWTANGELQALFNPPFSSNASLSTLMTNLGL